MQCNSVVPYDQCLMIYYSISVQSAEITSRGKLEAQDAFGEMITLIDSSSYCKGESQPANMGENSSRTLRPISQSVLSYDIP